MVELRHKRGYHIAVFCMQSQVDVDAEEGRGGPAAIPHHVPAQQLLPGEESTFLEMQHIRS